MADVVRRCDRIGELHCDSSRRDGVLCEVTPEGFLRCSAWTARTGVQVYEDADGNSWGELREDSEVFDPESLASLAYDVVTDQHPEDWVSSRNVRELQRGTTGPDARRDGRYVAQTVIIQDAELIAKIRGGQQELSRGYTATLVRDEGVHDGQPYIGRQTRIRGNHLAVVDRGRAGPECSLRLDGAAITTTTIFEEDHMPRPKKPAAAQGRQDATVQIGGQNIEVPDPVAAHIAMLESKLREAGVDPEEGPPDEPGSMGEEGDNSPTPSAGRPVQLVLSGDSEDATSRGRPPGSAGDARARADMAEAELARQRADEQRRVDERVDLVTSAREVTPGYDPAGKTDAQIRVDTILAVQPGLKNRIAAHEDDAGYLRCAFDSAMQLHRDRGRHLQDSAMALGGVSYGVIGREPQSRNDAKPDDLEVAVTRQFGAYQDGWKTRPSEEVA